MARAYLLIGTRGTGKTSTARILARAAICEQPQAGDPCGTCQGCEDESRGESTAITETDGASNRTAEDARTLRETVVEAEGLDRRSVFIIDEAHMLTRGAQENVRGMIEELDENCVIVLCTTEPEGLSETIRSRCQQHRFRRLRNGDIIDRLKQIAEAEDVEIANDALRALAHAANGSMRDGVTLLDQMAATSNGPITAENVSASMGGHFRQTILIMVRQMLDGSTDRALATLRQAASDGAEANEIHRVARGLLNDALAVSWRLERAGDLPETVRVALAEAEWTRIIAVINAWSAARPYADERNTARLERAIAETAGMRREPAWQS